MPSQVGTPGGPQLQSRNWAHHRPGGFTGCGLAAVLVYDIKRLLNSSRKVSYLQLLQASHVENSNYNVDTPSP